MAEHWEECLFVVVVGAMALGVLVYYIRERTGWCEGCPYRLMYEDERTGPTDITFTHNSGTLTHAGGGNVTVMGSLIYTGEDLEWDSE
jgi:hypothetical protein